MPYKDKERQKQAQHESYLRNKEKAYKASKIAKLEKFKWLDELKSKPCSDCGNTFPSYVMEFHHRNPEEKVMTIARIIITRGKNAVMEEIAKCDLLCSNCHRTREHKESFRKWLTD